MSVTRDRGRLVVAAAVAVLLAGPLPASAHWLSELGEIAATAGRTGGRLAREIPALEDAMRVISKLPAEAKAGAVAAEALPDGAWRFQTATGEVVTATSPEGVKGALTALVPDAESAGSKSLTFYIGEDGLLAHPEALAALPQEAGVQITLGETSYPLLRQGSGDAVRMFAEINPSLIVEIKDRGLLDQVVWQMQRPLGRSGVRVLALDAAGPKSLPTVVARTAGDPLAAERIDPHALASALASMPGQTIIVSGAIEGDVLRFGAGASDSILTAELTRAAEAGDVNLLLLDTGTPKQPGETTWLFQTRAVAGLDEAMAKATFGDFLGVLGQSQGRLAIDAGWGERGHSRLSATPAASDAPAASGETGAASGWSLLKDAADLSQLASGHVLPKSVSASLNDRDTQWDRDHRLIPFLPAWLQAYYAIEMLFGLVAFPETRLWWRFLLRRTSFGRQPMTWPRRIGSEIVYLLMFTPLVGGFALIAMFIRSIVESVLGFARAVGRLAGPGKGQRA